MPIIGSLDGTFGHGRSPQVSLPPGFIIYSADGKTTTWSFAKNGTFVMDGNVAIDIPSASSLTGGFGNCYVITPVATFIANVKIWGAGGGSANIDPRVGDHNHGGAGGYTYGSYMFAVGQPYTFFAGGAGTAARGLNAGPSQGGAASGILLGNVFASTTALPEIAIAGGGGGVRKGAAPNDAGIIFSGAGGGNIGQPGDNNQPYYNPAGTIGQGIPSGSYGSGSASLMQSGLPRSYGTATGKYYVSSTVFPNGTYGAGGGGYYGGTVEQGGYGFVDTQNEGLSTKIGLYAIPPNFDDSGRGLAGDADNPGRIIFFQDEYKVSNISATGGTITTEPIPGYELAYNYHTFTTSNSRFVVSSIGSTDTVDVFVVGGGGGGTTIGSGGGGGGVGFRSGLSIGAGTYLVDVGNGGNPYNGENGKGGIFGGYRGEDSSFYTNPLGSKGFPNSYWRLANSLGGIVRYINAGGDDSDGLTLTTAYNSFATALSKNANFNGLIVYIVLSGTYAETISATAIQTPINDQSKPRIFICAPNRVTISWTPVAGTTTRLDAPAAVLSHPRSAVYGAIFARSSSTGNTNNPEYAFFADNSLPGTNRLRGSFYNCVFKDSGPWSLINGDGSTYIRVENCTFSTTSNSVSYSSSSIVNWTSTPKALFKNCIFSKYVLYYDTTTSFENSVQNTTIASKYVVAAHPDKGVYAGDYGWGAFITSTPTTQKSVMIVGQGGGGATQLSYQDLIYPHAIGGSSGGSAGPTVDPAAATQYNYYANPDYSAYGFHGGLSASAVFSSGGGASYPGLNNGPGGGVGIEFPTGSNTYYGSGGNSKDSINITTVAPGTVGKGGDGGATPTAGNSGAVIVRYITTGPYTPPAVPAIQNLIAFGGQQVNIRNGYKEHIFTSSGEFRIANPNSNLKLDILIVAGGGGGAATQDYASEGGYGNVRYTQVDATTTYNMVVVGGGGVGGFVYNDWGADRQNGGNGGNSSFNNTITTRTVTGGAGGNKYNLGEVGSTFDYVPDDGPLITDGLFSDNTTRYGGQGGPGVKPRTSPILGGLGGGGAGGWAYPRGNYYYSYDVESGESGVRNTGGGGGGGVSGGYYYGYAGAGGSGIVIIRYPYNPS